MELGNGSNPTSIKYTLNGGALTSASAARLSSAAPGSLVSDFFTFNGGGWAINTGNQDTGANRGITVKSGGAFFGSTSLTVNTTISSPIVGTEGGGITLTNVGPFVGNAHQSGAQLLLTNTNNSWNGDATISSGTLRLGANGVIPDTAVIHLTTSGTAFNMTDFGGTAHTETVKSIEGTAGTVAVGTGNLTIADGAGLTYSSVFTGSAGGTITKNGSGTWVISGSSTGWQGEFILNNGTIGVGSANSFGNQGTAKVTINGGNLSNTGTGGRSINAVVSAALNGDFSVDDSLFNTSANGQILFNGTANMSASRTITVSGFANFGLTTITETNAGSTLTKNGTGILVIAGNNGSYTGDTTVNNGTLRYTSGTAGTYAGNLFVPGGRLEVDADGIVGSGSNTINLQGGALSCSASRTVAFFSPVNITANSAITTTSAAATPNFDFGDTTTGAPFNISGGVTLITLRNDGGDAATDQLRVRLFGSGFTISTPIDMPNGTASSTVELSSFNTTVGTQTFSGVISGTGDYKRSASTSGTGGTTIFTAANTFSGGVQLNDGEIDFGVDSVGPANAPTSGPVGTGTITTNNNLSVAVAASGGARNVGNPIAYGAGNNLGIAGANNLTLGGDVALGALVRTVTVTNTAQSVMSGTIGGSAGSGLIKTGAGSLKLTGANTWDGTAPSSGTSGTTVSGGNLIIDGASAKLGAGEVTVGAVLGAELSINSGVTNAISDLSILRLAGCDAAAGTGCASGVAGTADGGFIFLGSGINELVAGLSLSSDSGATFTPQVGGTYGATGSGATHVLDEYFSGLGILTVPSACAPGDLNCDGHVDGGDYVFWRKNGSTPPGDYDIWRANFGVPPGSGSGGGLSGSAAVPEPSSMMLSIVVLAGGLIVSTVRRRRIE
jgi:fibronectin-binding autotransporter adhesin